MFANPLEPRSPLHGPLRAVAARLLRSERRGHTLQPTALLHEAWLRLRHWPLGHTAPRAVLDVYAQAMRWILVDHARRRLARRTATAIAGTRMPTSRDCDVLAVDQALRELALRAPRQAKVVELRFFAGLSVPEVAAHLGVTTRTVVRDWATARATMSGLLHDGDADAR